MADALFREQLIAVQEWLAAYETGDEAAVLDARALDAARQLAASSTDDAATADEARIALARLWWHRFWALPPGQNLAELRLAAAQAAGSSFAGRHQLPAGLAALIDAEPEAAGEPADWAKRASKVLSDESGRRGLPEIEWSIELLRIASQATAPDRAERAAFLGNESTLRNLRYHHTQRLADLDDAIEAGRTGLAALGDGSPYAVVLNGNLALLLRARFNATGAAADLDDAIAAGRKATAGDSAYQAISLSGLGIALRLRFASSGEAADLDEAIEAGRAAAAAIPAADPERTVTLDNLAQALLDRFGRGQSLADLDEAVEAARMAAGIPGGRNLGHALSTLAGALGARFRQAGELADLDDAIAAVRALTESAGDLPARAGERSWLAGLLGERFGRTGGIDDLSAAVALRREALAAAGDSATERAQLQFALAMELGTRSQVTAEYGDLCEAVLLFTQALGPDPAVGVAERPRLRVAAARLTEWARTGDAAVLLDPGLTAVLAGLTTVDPRTPPDLSALCLAGWLHLLRHRAGRQEAEAAELMAAAKALDPVYLVAPFAVPALVAALYEAAEQDEADASGDQPSSPQEQTYELRNAAAMQLFDRYGASGGLNVLRAAISGFREATAVAGSAAESVAVAHNNLGLALLTLAQQTGERADAEGAAAAMRTAVENSAPQEPYLPGRISLLCAALTRLALANGDLALFDEAIDVGRQGMALTPDEHPSRGGFLSNLAVAFLSRYESGGDDSDADLREALSLLRQALPAVSPGDRYHAGCLHNLGRVLEALSERTGDLGTLTESVELTRDALAATPRGPVRLTLLERLGSALAAVFRQTGDPERLAEAIEASRAAMTGTPVGDPARRRRTTALILALNSLHATTGDGAALREAVGLLRGHIASLADADPAKADYLALLGLIVPDLATASDHTVLAEAAAALRAAVALTPPGSELYGRHSMNLADALARLYERTSGGAALAEAADAARDAVRAPAADEAALRDRLLILVRILRTRYETTGDIAELDEAIGAAEQALGAGGDIRWRAQRAELLFLRAAGAGKLAEMRKAAALVRDVLAEPGTRARYAGNAGSMLIQLYQFTGSLDELDEAIALLRLAVADDPSEPWVGKNSLAMALELRHQRTGDAAVLSEAVEMARAAAMEIPPAYAYRTLYLGNLGQLLDKLSSVTGDVSLLAEGVDAARAAVLAARSAPAYRPGRLAALAQLLLTLNLRTRDDRALSEAALSEAVLSGRAAVSESQESTSEHAKYLAIFGSVLLRQHAHDGDPAALREACDVLSGAATQPAASLSDRVAAARLWGEGAMRSGDPAQALRGYELAIDLLLQRVGPELARGDREYGLEASAGLPSEAAAAAIAAGDPARAVELLEHGRGVLLGEALQFRSDMSQLETRDPGLAAQFRLVGGQLAALQAPAQSPVQSPVQSPGQSPDQPAGQPPRTAERRAALAAEFSQIADRVRAVPGFADFLRAPALSVLQAGIGPGPVVIVNASRWRCDALIVTGDAVDLAPLPGLTLAVATERVNEYLASIQGHQRALQEVLWLRRQLAGPGDPSGYHRYHAAKVALDRQAGQMESTLLATMAWLWDAIAEPVLDRLGHTASPSPGAPWPRIWWCPTGPLTLLPLHAAGHHEPGRTGKDRAVGDRAVTERAVSSYAPSLRALIEARRAASGPPDEESAMLVVAMPATAGQIPLPNVSRERDLLTRLFQGNNTVLTGPAATRSAVLSALPAHRWAHFSCHGDQDLGEPSRGGLLLADGILTVADIGGGHYQGEFAFLSACKTGTGGVTLMDEAITLAAALQYAGYRHVVATSWSVYDTTAADVAESMYGRLAGDGLLHPADTALALHDAIRPLRRQFPDRPSVWMPFTHLGP